MLSQLGGHSSRIWSQRLAALGLEPREVMLFRQVALAEGGSQADVARAIGLPDSRIVGLVDRMEARGWLERRPSSRDRRSHALHLTDTGRGILRQVNDVSAEHEADLLRGLAPREQEELRELLGRVAASQGLIEGVHPGFADMAADPQAAHGGSSHGVDADAEADASSATDVTGSPG
jgi:DNA-binding MarR family transcriptional regulator